MIMNNTMQPTTLNISSFFELYSFLSFAKTKPHQITFTLIKAQEEIVVSDLTSEKPPLADSVLVRSSQMLVRSSQMFRDGKSRPAVDQKQ